MERNESIQVEVQGKGCGILIVLWEVKVRLCRWPVGSGPGGHHLDTDRLHLTTSAVYGLFQHILYKNILLGVECYQLIKFCEKRLTWLEG